MLRNNGLKVSSTIENALRKFCGDVGIRPMDIMSKEDLDKRKSTSERFFLEEVGKKALDEIINFFGVNQRRISEIILKYAYDGDPFPPEFVLHKTTNVISNGQVSVAIHSMEELLDLSEKFSPFILKEYTIKKGTWKNDPNVHLAPQLGFMQFQRKGSKKNATQLQFNLKAGYFYFKPEQNSSSLKEFV